MVRTSSSGIPYKLISFVLGVLFTVLGIYLLAVFFGEVSHVLSLVSSSYFFAGIILFAAGIIILGIMISRWLHRK